MYIQIVNPYTDYVLLMDYEFVSLMNYEFVNLLLSNPYVY